MPATQINTQSVVGPYPALPVTAASLDLVFTAADVANGNFFVADMPISVRPEGVIGGDVLLVWNTDATPHNFTLTSQPDDAGRNSDTSLSPYVVGAGVISAFKLSEIVGWASGNNVFFSADNALVKFAILRR